MSSVLIVYSTVDGHTLEICRRLQHVIEQQAHSVHLVCVDDAPGADPALFDKVVIGASIRYGKHRPQVYDFIRRHAQVLARKPAAFFTVNLVARKPGKATPQTNPYLRDFHRRTSWQPAEMAVFAGKIDYPRYSFADRQIIRLIMWLTKGPTDPRTVEDFTDWNAVDALARRVCAM